MKKKLLLLAVLCSPVCAVDVVTPRMGLDVPGVGTSGPDYATRINYDFSIIDSSVALLASSNTYTSSNTYNNSIIIPGIANGVCLTVDVNGKVTGQACGGGGSSAVAIFVNGVQISSPTNQISFSGNNFRGTLAGPATAQIDLLPTTTYFIQNTTTLQLANFNVSTGTIGSLTASTATISSATITNATISGPTLSYATGTFTTAVLIGTTNANTQNFRIIDTAGVGLMSYESTTTNTLNFNLRNDTSGTGPSLNTSILGSLGDSATGGVSGDGILRATNSLYLIGGGAASSRGVQISSRGITHMYFSDGSTQTTATGGATAFIQNTSSLQSGSTFYVSSGTVLGTLSINTGRLDLTGYSNITYGTTSPTSIVDLNGSDANSDPTPLLSSRYTGVGTGARFSSTAGDAVLIDSGVLRVSDPATAIISTFTASSATVNNLYASTISVGSNTDFFGNRLYGLSWSEATKKLTVEGTLMVDTSYPILGGVTDNGGTSIVWPASSQGNVIFPASTASGYNATAIGSGLLNATGSVASSSTVLGQGSQAVKGSISIGVGTFTGGSSAGNGTINNTIIGNAASANPGSAKAIENTVVGSSATISWGSNPTLKGITLIGSKSGTVFSSGSSLLNATAIGYNANVSASSTVVLGDTTVPTNVAIGESAVATRSNLLEVNGNIGSLFGLVSSTLTVTSTSTLTAVYASSVTITTVFQLPPRTLAQLAASTPTALGQEYYCSDCTTDAVCTSTQTVTAKWSRQTSKATACQ